MGTWKKRKEKTENNLGSCTFVEAPVEQSGAVERDFTDKEQGRVAEGFNLIGLPNVRTAALPINESARSGFRVVDIIHSFEERRFGKETLFVYFVRTERLPVGAE